MHDDGAEIVIGATFRSWASVFFFGFTLLWTALAITGTSKIFARGASFPQNIVVVAFLVISAAMIAACACLLLGCVEIRIRGNQGEVRSGLGPIGYRRRFEASSIVRVYEGYAGWEHDGRRVRAIFMEGPTRLKFGSWLSDERRYFVVGALQKALGL